MASWIKKQFRRGGKVVRDAVGLGKDPNIEAQKLQQKQVKQETQRAMEVQGRRTRDTVVGFQQDADAEVANAIAMLGMTGAIDMTGGEKDTVTGDKIKFEKRQASFQINNRKLPGHVSIKMPVIEKGNRIGMGGTESEEVLAMRGEIASNQQEKESSEEYRKSLGAEIERLSNAVNSYDTEKPVRSPKEYVQLKKELQNKQEEYKKVTDKIGSLEKEIGTTQGKLNEVTKYLGSDLQEVRNVLSEGDAGSLTRGSSLLNLVQYRDEMEKDRRAIVRAGQEDLIGYQKTGEFADKQMKLLDKAQSLTRMRNAVGLGMQVGTMVATGGYSAFAGGGGINYGAGLLGFMTGQVVR
jgi:hypothetical protein